MLTRREFILKTFEYGGFGALAMMGLEKEAKSHGILPAVVSTGTGAGSWATWDETSGADLNTDQDGDGVDDTILFMMQNPVAGGNETAYAGTLLSGADLVLTQTGTVAGATGSPPSRVIDNIDDLLTFTENLGTACCGNLSYWIVIQKWLTLADVNSSGLLYMHTQTGDERQMYTYISNSKYKVFMYAQAAIRINTATADDLTFGVPIYTCVLMDGTNFGGFFDYSKPTSYAAVPANQKVSTAYPFQFDTMSSNKELVCNGDIGAWRSGTLLYTLFSKASSVCEV